jgi:hypothetical protein
MISASKHRISELNKLTLASVVERDPDIISAEAGEDVVMVSIEKGLYYGVSDVAREIWSAIDRPVRISDLIDDLARNHHIDRHSCEEETLSFLEDLLAERLLRVRYGPSA